MNETKHLVSVADTDRIIPKRPWQQPPNPREWKITVTLRNREGYNSKPHTAQACVLYWQKFVASEPFYNEDKTYFAILRLFERNTRIRGHCLIEAEPEPNLADVVKILNPEEIFRQAVIESCDSVVLMHNDPNENDPVPSWIEIGDTRSLAQAARVYGLEVADHIIVGRKLLYSYRHNGLLPT